MKIFNESYKFMGSIYLMLIVVFVILCINNVIGYFWFYRKSFVGIILVF